MSNSHKANEGKRVLIFSTAYFPFVGGAEIAVREITDRLGGEFEFDLITARLDKSLPSIEEVGAVTVYRLGVGLNYFDKFFLPYLGAWKAWQLNKTKHYTCFWGIMVTFATGSAYIVNILRSTLGLKKIPMILTLQEGDSEKHLTSAQLGLVGLSWKMALRRTDILTAISNYLLKRAERLGFRGASVLVPNGVDVGKFKVQSSKFKVEIREKLGFKKEDFVLITTSRLVEKNAVGDIIEALAQLPEEYKLLVLGEGPLESKLKLQTTNLQLQTRVKFLGQVEYDEIPKYLHASDVFVRPSLSEGFGNSFIEAMAAGLPVIATPVGGIIDFLESEVTGLTVEPHDPDSIAMQIKRLREEPELSAKLTLNARKMVDERYSWDLIASEMRDKVFNKVDENAEAKAS